MGFVGGFVIHWLRALQRKQRVSRRSRSSGNSAPRYARRASAMRDCCGKIDLDRADRRERTEVRQLLGAVMKAKKSTRNERPSLLDVVALLADFPAQQLARGQVGTIVEQLDDRADLPAGGSARPALRPGSGLILSRHRPVRGRHWPALTLDATAGGFP